MNKSNPLNNRVPEQNIKDVGVVFLWNRDLLSVLHNNKLIIR